MSVDNPPKEAIDVKQAVAIATNYLSSLYTPDVRDVLLEEVELVDDQEWKVTLSFARPSEDPSWGGLIPPPSMRIRTAQRHFRVFFIRADNGRIRAMKMRAPDA